MNKTSQHFNILCVFSILCIPLRLLFSAIPTGNLYLIFKLASITSCSWNSSEYHFNNSCSTKKWALVKKERNSHIFYSMDEPCGHYAKGNKLSQKAHTAWLQLYEIFRIVKTRERESRMVVFRDCWELGNGELLFKWL